MRFLPNGPDRCRRPSRQGDPKPSCRSPGTATAVTKYSSNHSNGNSNNHFMNWKLQPDRSASPGASTDNDNDDDDITATDDYYCLSSFCC